MPPPLPPVGLFIDGRFVDASEGRRFETRSPASGKVLTEVSSATETDVDHAVSAARRVFDSGAWSRTTAGERKRVLLSLAEIIDADSERLACLDSLEAGRPISECTQFDIPDAVATLRWYAEAGDKVFGKIAPPGEEHLALIVREPIGVVGCVLPWNYPLATLIMKIAPALAAGNSVVVKPAELASLSALRVAELSVQCDLPPGVLNVLPGTGETAGRALGRHPDVDAISFTGSTRIGREFLRYSADTNLKRIVLELGGKSPQVVTFSMREELEHVAADVADAAFSHAGQNCTASSRVLVDRRLETELSEILSRIAAERVVGDPADPRTDIGPVIHGAAAERVLDAVEEAVTAGARLTAGGHRVRTGSGGHYLAPTVLTDVSPDLRVAREELFGPVVVVLGFDSEEQAIALANDTSYGLAATVWSRRLDQAVRLARSIRAGTVAVNGYSEGDVTTPFGGWRQSGFGGVDNGLEAFEQYTELKTIWIGLS